MSNSPWHYPRTTFADQVLGAFLTGGSTALTLFAPRRTGKTQFLMHDLGPAAAAKGCTVIYASFWQTADTPVATLMHAIDSGLARPGLWQRTQNALGGMTPKLRVAPMGIGGEIDFARPPTPEGTNDPLLALDDKIASLPASYDTPLLLMLDEVQGLATPEHQDFVAALRTSLDKRRDTVRTIFTGSNLDGLRAMFSNRQAPFFHFGSNIDLPQLDGDFVRHVLAAHKAATTRDVPFAAAMTFFEQVNHSPYMMRNVLERMALNPQDDFETAA
ncbi:MAG: ATP-binding protein, partial [Pseudomonadota bacterium]